MSDYGDGDYSDGDFDFDPWFYVEETYQAADDLAEHAIASPPPTYADDSSYEDWDRFDYWNDIESGSEGYDDEGYQGENSPNEVSKTGQKRKRADNASSGRKKQKMQDDKVQVSAHGPLSPTPTVLWRSQEAREQERKSKVRLFDEANEPYALLKDWRERLSEMPQPHSRPSLEPGHDSESILIVSGRSRQGSKGDPLSPSSEPVDAEMEELAAASGLVPDALMTALQNRLAESGGAFEGSDQSMLLKYAMRMMANEEESDEIVGELAEDVLNRPNDDPMAAGISSWLAQQMGTPKKGCETDPEKVQNNAAGLSSAISPFAIPVSPAVAAADQHPPTPSSTETSSNATPNKLSDALTSKTDKKLAASTVAQGKATSQSSRRKAETKTTVAPEPHPVSQLRTCKRKAEDTHEVDDGSESLPTPKRATRSYNAPTATSQTKAHQPAPARTTRSGRGRHG
ncbi:hypothetical protein K432DRAFT_400129 [Lepidopterella palustris CBS 459.81]|uniref:Uncharacterized protein n=1 Tax=Lepidopterella palustris CBS 459.81 TaxID=1314670 RepID=A0A8E2EKI9_9PEZI|nr:hypothetical protein K432DRAFT_400129 [Lepidopterella palustris CBS 459.81]